MGYIYEENIKWIQYALQKAGYHKIKCTGEFNRSTEQNVRDFQKKKPFNS